MELITTLKGHLSGKERYERAKTMRKNLKVRKQRFQDSDKTHEMWRHCVVVLELSSVCVQ